MKLMLESYETSMNGVLRWVHKRRTVVDGEVYQTDLIKGDHYSL